MNRIADPNLIADRLWELDEDDRDIRIERDADFDDYLAGRIDRDQWAELSDCHKRALRTNEADRVELLKTLEALSLVA